MDDKLKEAELNKLNAETDKLTSEAEKNRKFDRWWSPTVVYIGLSAIASAIVVYISLASYYKEIYFPLATAENVRLNLENQKTLADNYRLSIENAKSLDSLIRLKKENERTRDTLIAKINEIKRLINKLDISESEKQTIKNQLTSTEMQLKLLESPAKQFYDYVHREQAQARYESQFRVILVPSATAESVYVYFHTPGESVYVDVIVKDTTGKRIRSLLQRVKQSDGDKACWDGTDDKGKNQQSGKYLIEAWLGEKFYNLEVNIKGKQSK